MSLESFPSNPPNRESRESSEYGHNVALNIELIRHAERDVVADAKDITEEGVMAAKEYGRARKFKAYHSNVPGTGADVRRTEQTARALTERSPYHVRPKKLGIYPGEISEESIARLDQLIREDEGDETRALQFMLELKDDEAGRMNSKDISRRLAEHLLHFVRLSSRLRDNSKVNIALVSHSQVIEHLLPDMLGMDREDFASQIGGAVTFLEGPHFLVRRADKENVVIQMRFRDFERTLTEADLEQMAEQK